MLERTLIFLLLVLFYHGASCAAATKPDWRVEWEKTVAAAEKEGVVSIYIFDGGPLTEETVHAFERAYPKIKVSQLRGRGNALGPGWWRSGARENTSPIFSPAARVLR
jgi:hypothetical protein